MSGTQFPLWVTYSLAVIAILGPIGGAVLGAFFSARRERVREDLRWERERLRLADERAHETLLHWSEKRAEAYGAYMAAFDAWLRHARRVILKPRVLPDEPQRAELDRLSSEMQDLVGTIQLMTASEGTRERCSAIVGYCQLFEAGIGKSIYSKMADPLGSIETHLEISHRELFKLFRDELGTGAPLPEIERVSPSPPSDSTS